MTNVISALTARTQPGQIIKRASEKNERFVIGRRGEPKVVIMGIRDYVDTLAPAPDWLESAWEDARRKGVDKLRAREIKTEVAAYRREKQVKDLKKAGRQAG